MSSDANRKTLTAEDSFPHERYDALEKLGSGAYGAVYRCRDKLLKRTVSIKTLFNLTESQVIDFQKEARALSALQHPGIVSILDFGISEKGFPYLVMEFIEGKTLEQHLKEHGTLPTSVALELFTQVAESLAYAHSKGIYHRDLKPANILLSENKLNELHAKLIDFGMSATALSGETTIDSQGKTLVGTPAYMSPDQISGDVFDAASETYTLCCALFETIIGGPPFTAVSALELLALHANEPAPSMLEFETGSVVFRRLDEVIRQKGLAKRKSQRFRTMSELASALGALIETARDLEIHGITGSSTNEELTDSPRTTEADLKAVNARYSMIFVACLVAMVSVIPIIAYTMLNRSEFVKHPRPAKTAETNSIDMSNIDFVVGGLDSDGISMKMDSCKVINNFDIKKFKALTKNKVLRKISFTNVHLTPEDVRAVAPLKPTSFNMNQCAYNDRVFKEIAAIPSITSLQVASGLLTLPSMRLIASMPNLNYLDLNGSNVDDKLLQTLTTSKLKQLDVHKCEAVTGKGLSRGMEQLTYFRASKLSVSGKDLAFLKGLPNLKILELFPIDLTDEDAKQIKNPELHSVRIDSEYLTIKGVKLFATLPNIRFIEVGRTPSINESSIRTLAHEFPGIKIQLFDSPLKSI